MKAQILLIASPAVSLMMLNVVANSASIASLQVSKLDSSRGSSLAGLNRVIHKTSIHINVESQKAVNN